MIFLEWTEPCVADATPEQLLASSREARRVEMDIDEHHGTADRRPEVLPGSTTPRMPEALSLSTCSTTRRSLRSCASSTRGPEGCAPFGSVRPDLSDAFSQLTGIGFQRRRVATMMQFRCSGPGLIAHGVA